VSAEFLTIAGLIFLGALAQGSTGVGLGLVATPLVAAIDPTLVPGPMLVPMIFAATWTGWRDRGSIDLAWSLAAIVGRLPGVIVGAWIFAIVSFKVYAWLFAGTILAGVILSLFGPKFRATLASLAAGGFCAGVMGTLTSVGAPPMMLVLQHGNAPRVRATLSVFFAIGSSMSIGALALFGRFGWTEAFLGFLLVPPMILGVVLSKHLTGCIDRGALRPVLLTLAAAAAPLLIYRAFFFS
jgi:uncharacterized protein